MAHALRKSLLLVNVNVNKMSQVDDVTDVKMHTMVIQTILLETV